jgi:hypothetical protein
MPVALIFEGALAPQSIRLGLAGRPGRSSWGCSHIGVERPGPGQSTPRLAATGTGWERTPWHATQRAAWEMVRLDAPLVGGLSHLGRWLARDLGGGNLPASHRVPSPKPLNSGPSVFGMRFAPLDTVAAKAAEGGHDVENSELVAKVERWLNDVSDALHRLSRERDVLRETRTQILMGVLSAAQAEANLSRLIQWRDGESSGLPADIVAQLR